MKNIKSIIFLISIKLIFISFNTIYPVPSYVTFLTEKDGTTHKCNRLDYLEMTEILEAYEKDNDIAIWNYHIWEKDFRTVLLSAPKAKTDYGKLHYIRKKKWFF